MKFDINQRKMIYSFRQNTRLENSTNMIQAFVIRFNGDMNHTNNDTIHIDMISKNQVQEFK